MTPPCSTENRSVAHNLMKRSLGLPHQFQLADNGILPFPQLDSSDESVNIHRYVNHVTNDIPDTNRRGDDGSLEGDAPENTADISHRGGACSANTPRTVPKFSRLFLNNLINPYNIPLPPCTDKVFCSTFLDDNHIIVGTKCHQLLVYNIAQQKFLSIPTLANRCSPCPLGQSGGVRTIKVNSAGTLLATCGREFNSVAVYNLPSMTPLLVAEGVHNNWIFDVCWLSDTRLAVGCRDRRISIWNFEPCLCQNPRKRNEDDLPSENSDDIDIEHERQFTGYSSVSQCESCVDFSWKVRAVEYDHKRSLFALTTGGTLHCLDSGTLKIKRNFDLPGYEDNTCLAYSDRLNMLALGSTAGLLFVDPRDENGKYTEINLPYSDSFYVRSLCFCEDFLSIGTGTGELLFLDLRLLSLNAVAFYSTRLLARRHHPNETNPCPIMYPNLPDMAGGRSPTSQNFSNTNGIFHVSDSLTSHDTVPTVLEYRNTSDRIFHNPCTRYVGSDRDHFSPNGFTFCPRQPTSILSDRMAVYSHCYDSSKGRLFLAGGPIAATDSGSFCTLYV